MRSALFIPILLMLVGIGLSFWGIWGVSTAYGDLSEGHEVAKEGVMARDWDQANRGVSTLFVDLVSLTEISIRGDLSEGHEVAKEGVMARDWDQANRGVSTLFVAIKSL